MENGSAINQLRSLKNYNDNMGVRADYKKYLKEDIIRLENKLIHTDDPAKKNHIKAEIQRMENRCGKAWRHEDFGQGIADFTDYNIMDI